MVQKVYVFGQVGENGGQSGGEDTCRRFRGHTPATCGQKGGSFCPLQRRGPGRPKNVLGRKKITVCVLGMGCGRLASASELHLRQVGARGNACRARVLSISPRWPKNQGAIPHFDHFSFVFWRPARAELGVHWSATAYEYLSAGTYYFYNEARPRERSDHFFPTSKNASPYRGAYRVPLFN